MDLHGDESPRMASVAKLDGVPAKFEGSIMLLRFFIKMAFFTVLPSPVRVYDLVAGFRCDKVRVHIRNKKQNTAKQNMIKIQSHRKHRVIVIVYPSTQEIAFLFSLCSTTGENRGI